MLKCDFPVAWHYRDFQKSKFLLKKAELCSTVTVFYVERESLPPRKKWLIYFQLAFKISECLKKFFNMP